MFRQISCKRLVPKYNGETGAPVLYVEFQDFLGKTYVDDPEAEAGTDGGSLQHRPAKQVELQLLGARVTIRQTNLVAR